MLLALIYALIVVVIGRRAPGDACGRNWRILVSEAKNLST
jgi:hypothetical protein